MEQIERIVCGIVNCYLITGEGGRILVDAGNPSDGEAILERIGDAGVKLILLTHGHTDHIGAAALLSERLGAPIGMHEADLPLIEQPALRRLYGHTPLGRALAKVSETSMSGAAVPRFSPAYLFDDGEDLTRFGVRARVVTLPGHTAGSIGVLLQDGALIAGDAACHMLRRTGARIYEDRDVAARSVEKMRRMGAKRLYVGHGSSFSIDAI